MWVGHSSRVVVRKHARYVDEGHHNGVQVFSGGVGEPMMALRHGKPGARDQVRELQRGMLHGLPSQQLSQMHSPGQVAELGMPTVTCFRLDVVEIRIGQGSLGASP